VAAGLVVSTANFLTDGHVLDNAGAAAAWAWVQALALDSSLGISFYYVLQNLKQRDWLKFGLYLVLTGLLTLVAGSITNVDIFSHAIHTTMSNALSRLGFDVGLLSTLRSIAVEGFVLMSRLKDVSFKDLYHAKEEEPATSAPAPAHRRAPRSPLKKWPCCIARCILLRVAPTRWSQQWTQSHWRSRSKAANSASRARWHRRKPLGSHLLWLWNRLSLTKRRSS
jgi:hypothetical protein